MKVIEPYTTIITPINEHSGITVMKRIEEIGRVCYKSEGKITEDSYKKFIANLIKRGHESVLEHCSVTVKFVCDRGVSHEIVRHRLASYSQESTRYCNYSGDQFGNEITVIKPCFWEEDMEAYRLWLDSCKSAEMHYFLMLKSGASPQEARSVLPNSLKTEVVMTANIREWRHFFKLRCSQAAHPQMREVARMALLWFYTYMPELFEDIVEEVGLFE